MGRWKNILSKGPDYIHRVLWKKIGHRKDKQLEKQFRLLYRGTQREIEDMVDRYRREQIGFVMGFLLAAFMLVLLAGIGGNVASSAITIERNSYGEGEKEESLVLESGETIYFTVGEQEYNKAELKQAFSDGFLWVRENMLLDNSSAGEVRSNLDFMTEVPGGFTAEWIPEDPELIGYDGQVFNEDWDEDQSRIVRVHLTLSYKEEMQSQNISFCIKGPVYTAKERLIRQITKAIESQEKSTRKNSSFVLPKEIEGVSLQQSGTNRFQGLIILLAALFVFLFSYRSNRMKEKGEERKGQLAKDYPLLVNKLVLYLGAGMNLKNSFQQIADEYVEDLKKGRTSKRYVYEEVMVMVNEMKAGEGEQSAYEAFGRRMDDNYYAKLISLLVQNLQKGNDGLLKALQSEEENAFFLRIDQAKKAGEEAGTKLLFPMILMLLIVMVIVMAPAIFQFGTY